MSILKVATIQNSAGTEIYTAKAWVNFNGSGVVAVRASGNVSSSVTDNGTGDYTISYSTAITDANYATLLTGNTDIPTGSDYGVIPVVHPTVAQTTTAMRTLCAFTGNGTLYDLSQVNVGVLR